MTTSESGCKFWALACNVWMNSSESSSKRRNLSYLKHIAALVSFPRSSNQPSIVPQSRDSPPPLRQKRLHLLLQLYIRYLPHHIRQRLLHQTSHPLDNLHPL